jgi:hypothetical protein
MARSCGTWRRLAHGVVAEVEPPWARKAHTSAEGSRHHLSGEDDAPYTQERLIFTSGAE